MNNLKEMFGECISVYTRQQAIDDGVLVDVTTVANEAGFKWPTAMTRAVYDRYVEVPEELAGCQDISGRCWDIMPSTRLCRVSSDFASIPYDILNNCRLFSA